MALLDLPDRSALPVPLVLMALKGQQVQLGHKGRLVSEALPEPPELPGPLEHTARSVRLDHKGPPAQLERKVKSVLRGLMDQSVPPAQSVSPARTGRPDQSVSPAQSVPPARTGLKEQKVIREHRESTTSIHSRTF